MSLLKYLKLRYSLDEATKVFVPENGENITLLMDPAATVKNLSITLLRGRVSNPIFLHKNRAILAERYFFVSKFRLSFCVFRCFLLFRYFEIFH